MIPTIKGKTTDYTLYLHSHKNFHKCNN